MPILTVKVSAKKSKEISSIISTMLSELTVRILGKKSELISIVIDYVEPDDWFIAGKSLLEHGKNSFYFDIKITDETNTKAEKQQYIYEAFQAFKQLLGDLHDESYIYIQDVRATAYGYGGLTQEHRFHHAA